MKMEIIAALKDFSVNYSFERNHEKISNFFEKLGKFSIFINKTS